MKLESYPFDWIISRLWVIRDCIHSNYQEFLNIENYCRITTRTIHAKDNGSQEMICEESILYNRYYQPSNSNPASTYEYNLAFNHRDITTKQDYEYICRCIERLKQLFMETRLYKISVYIHPVLNDDVDLTNLIEDFKDFHSFLSSQTTKLSGLYFILARRRANNLQPNKGWSTIDCLHSSEKCVVYVIHCNAELIDAGEIFQGQCETEVELISQKIRERIIEDSRDYLMSAAMS